MNAHPAARTPFCTHARMHERRRARKHTIMKARAQAQAYVQAARASVLVVEDIILVLRRFFLPASLRGAGDGWEAAELG